MTTKNINLHLLAGDRRRTKRKRVLKTAKLVFGGFSPSIINCHVIDLSDSGARIETAVMVQIPEFLSLRLSDKTVRPVRRPWAIGNQIGLEFLTDADTNNGRN